MQDTKSTYKNQLCFYPCNNELPKGEIKKTIPFSITSKIIQYLLVNLTKGVKDLYIENYKILLKKIEEDTNIERYPMFVDWKN